jgi:sensor histidine kinase regulating citrate/malate metabolism
MIVSERYIPFEQILNAAGSNRSLVDVQIHPYENKVIIFEKKEISFAELKRMVGNTTNLIADVQIETSNNRVRVELESEQRFRNTVDVFVNDNNGIRLYHDASRLNKDRQDELRRIAINKRINKQTQR